MKKIRKTSRKAAATKAKEVAAARVHVAKGKMKAKGSKVRRG